MVLGLKTKTRKSSLVHLDYIIHIQEIKPWPPSQSLRTLRAVLIQWEHGEKNSGSTNQVVPSLGMGTGVGDGRIEFNESFKLPVTLIREMSIRGGGESFQKNCIEFNLYEPRRDKAVKGQLLGTAILDLADYGIVKDSLSINAPINCKRTYGNTAQPFLFLKIQPVEKSRSSSSSRDSLMREASMDRNHGESVSALMSEEYAEEESEVASFTTDDDVSSHSSLAVTFLAGDSNGSLSPQNKENGTVAANCSSEAKPNHVSDQFGAEDHEQTTGSCLISSVKTSRSSSIDLSSDLALITKKIMSRSSQSAAAEAMKNQQSSNNKCDDYEHEEYDIQENLVSSVKDIKLQLNSKEGILTSPKETLSDLDHPKGFAENGHTGDEPQKQYQKYAEEVITVEDKQQEIEDEPLSGSPQVNIQKQVMLDNVRLSATNEKFVVNNNISNIDRSKSVKSVRSSVESSRSSGSVTSNQFFMADAHNKIRESTSSELKDAKVGRKEINVISDNRIHHLENRIKVLEGELKEAAAIEVSLYSVLAEHGSSTNKVHAPARRLSRLYFHADKQSSSARRGSAAKSVVSGLVLVAKACGNDVPRLTFWLSNSIALRVIVERSCGNSQLHISVGTVIGKGGVRNGNNKSPSLKWEPFPVRNTRSSIEESFSEWDNPRTFAAALQKVESWIFSRIIESIWWQTFTPHMQCGAAKAIRISLASESRKLYQRTSSSVEQQQGNSSLELWKKAFRDAYESICPVRAGGHDCGCLPSISRLIMEQLIARLDVAMFNAILRESVDEIPSDPVADPISDAEVLPVPAGKASFGAGAQLKNAIGNWSRWLSDLFGIDDDLLEKENNSAEADEGRSRDTSSKPFHLLNALSDLMMLPKDMLLSRTIRKEVCPTFGPPIIRRVLNSFIPDEFCPDPIPGVVLEALNSEDSFDCEKEDCIMNFPCAAAPIIYQHPSAASVGSSLFGEIGNHHPQLTHSGSSVLKKSQTSDDELDELDSPLKSIIHDQSSPSSSSSSVKPGWLSKENGSGKAQRYQLLRAVWMNSD